MSCVICEGISLAHAVLSRDKRSVLCLKLFCPASEWTRLFFFNPLVSDGENQVIAAHVCCVSGDHTSFFHPRGGILMVAQWIKGSACQCRRNRVRSLVQEDPVEEGTATHSSILAWTISMDRGAWWGHSLRGSQRVKHDPTTKQQASLWSLDCRELLFPRYLFLSGSYARETINYLALTYL